MILAIYLVMIVINIIFISDIKNLIIAAKMKSTEWIALSISLVIIAGLIFNYGSTMEHYILGVLGGLLVILALYRRGITSKGFRSFKGILRWGDWDRVKLVIVSLQGQDIKVEFSVGYAIEIHFYKMEHYDRIIQILKENLSNEVVRIVK